MSYDYYRNAYPGWGTSEFRLGTPPPPRFQPQAAWRGWDYYQAHGVNPDHGLFSSILRGVRSPSMGADNFSSNDVRSLHRRIYSGLVNLGMVLPNEIGSAAAYEAYRSWKHHAMLYQPLGGDSTREREGLVGLAVAEASRLWNYSGRPMDTFAIRHAMEAAASTASMLYYRKLEREAGVPPPRNTDMYERDYAYGEDHPLHHNPRPSSIPSVIRTGSIPGITPPGSTRTAPIPMSRPRTGSFGGGMAGSLGSSPSMYASSFNNNSSPYRGNVGMPSYGGGGGGGYGGVAAAPPPMLGGVTTSQSGMYGGGMPGQYPYSNMGQPGGPMGQAVIPGQAMYPSQGSLGGGGGGVGGGGGFGMPYQSSMYGGGTVVPGQTGMYGNNGSIYPGVTPTTGSLTAYNGGMPMAGGYPPGTIIIRQPHRSRRSSSSGRHHHHHQHSSSSSKHRHHRSRSIEPPLLLDSGAYDSGGGGGAYYYR